MTIVALGDICEFVYGKALPKTKREMGPVPVYGSNGVIGTHTDPLSRSETIIIGRKGSVGELNYSSSPCWPIDTTYYIDRSSTTEDLRWLFYALHALRLPELNKATGVPGLNRNDAYVRKIYRPAPDEQRRIAAILDKADAIRRKREQALTLADDFLRSVFLEMFGDPAENPFRFPVEPLANATSKFSDGPFGSHLKSEHYTDEGIRVVRLQNIGIGEFLDRDKAFISVEHFESLKKHECISGDVLVGTLGDPNLRACLLPASIGRALNKADCVQIRPKKGRSTAEFICGLLNQPSTEHMAQSLILGQTRSRISMGRLKTLEVPIPPFDLQQAYSVVVNRAVAHKDRLISAVDVANDLFSALSQRAFRGEL